MNIYIYPLFLEYSRQINSYVVNTFRRNQLIKYNMIGVQIRKNLNNCHFVFNEGKGVIPDNHNSG